MPPAMTSSPLWSADVAAAATGGRITDAWEATGVSIDTRSLAPGDLFIALSGPNFDGHNFVDAAFEAGAGAAMVSTSDTSSGRSLLMVGDTLHGLRALGRGARLRMKGQVAAITGSVGKTGTKEALAHALRPQGSVSASQSSLNNHWGVPLSLARMPADTDYGVFEIGMNHAGEITDLVSLAIPHVAVVTAIAPAHMAYFDSIEDIARAKAEIFSSLEDGVAVINRDTEHFELLARIALDTGARKVIGFGRHADADMRLMECLSTATGNEIDARWHGEPLHYRVEQPGAHWAYNSLAVLAAADAMGADLAQAAASLATLPSLKGRGALHTLPWGDGTLRLIDDAYNANPVSMRSALDTLGGLTPVGGRRVAVLGDMLELGDGSAQAHAALKDHLDRNKIDLVYLAGREIDALADALPADRIGGRSENAAGLIPQVIAGVRAGDIVTVKASHGIALESLVAALLEHASADMSATENNNNAL